MIAHTFDNLELKVMAISGAMSGLGFVFGMIFQGFLGANRRDEELSEAYDRGYEAAVDDAVDAETDCMFPDCPVLKCLQEETQQRARMRRHDAFWGKDME